MDSVHPDILRGIILVNYSAVIAFTVAFYDIVLTSAFGIERILLGGRWTGLKVLYFALREGSIILQVIPIALYQSIIHGRLRDTSPICHLLVAFRAAGSLLSIMGVQTVLILRIQAMYNEYKRLLNMLRIFFVAEVLVMLSIQIYTIPRLRMGPLCIVTGFPSASLGFWVPPLLFDLVLFLLGVAKFYVAVKDRSESILRRFYSDGVWAFIIPFSALITNALVMKLVEGPKAAFTFPWIVPVSCFSGYHLILRMTDMLDTSSATSGTEPRQVFSTVELSRGMVSADFEMDEVSQKSTP